MLPCQVELCYDITCWEVCEHHRVNHLIPPKKFDTVNHLIPQKDFDTTSLLKILRHRIYEYPLSYN